MFIQDAKEAEKEGHERNPEEGHWETFRKKVIFELNLEDSGKHAESLL